MDHNGVPSLHVPCMSKHIAPARYKQIAKSLAVNINPIRVEYMKNKITLIDKQSV